MSDLGTKENLAESADRRRRFCVCLSLLAIPLISSSPAFADELGTLISDRRVRLSDVAPHVPRGIAQVDLGQAPPPGKTRYFSYKEMAIRLRAAGISASGMKLPKGIRVRSEGHQFSTQELSKMVLGPVRDALPAGVHLEKIVVRQPRLLSPSVKAGQVRLPRFVAKEGTQTQTGTVEILWGEQVAMRLPVRMSVRISESVAGTVVRRGTHVTLSIRRGNVEISATARTLSAGRVGELVSLKVGVTKKVLSARLVAEDRAELEI